MTDTNYRLLPVALHPAIEEALKRHCMMPNTAWQDVIAAWDRVKPAVGAVDLLFDPLETLEFCVKGTDCQNMVGINKVLEYLRATSLAAPERSGKTADEKSIRDYPEFREYLERLSEPGLAKAQAKVIRKEIYDIIDARVRNLAAPAASSSAVPSVVVTWQERRAEWFKRNSQKREGPANNDQFMAAEIADLRAALATPSVQAVAAGQELTDAECRRIKTQAAVDTDEWADGLADEPTQELVDAFFVRSILDSVRHLTKPPALAGDTQAGE